MPMTLPNRQCLIVDDSDVVRRVTRYMLAALKFDPSEAETMADALDRCKAAMPDVVILDWRLGPASGAMGGALGQGVALSGVDCLQSLRRLPGGSAPVVLYCMTEHDAAEEARARKAGASDIILKPYDRETLRQRLESCGLA